MLCSEVESLSKCVISYMEENLGCRIPFSQLQSQFARNCSTLSEYESFIAMLTRFETITENGVARETGCLPPCVQSEFELTAKHFREIEKYYDYQEDVDVTISITRTQYAFHEDIGIYPGSSFIADVGGMMGLLLGASIFSMFEQCRERISRLSQGSLSEGRSKQLVTPTATPRRGGKA